MTTSDIVPTIAMAIGHLIGERSVVRHEERRRAEQELEEQRRIADRLAADRAELRADVRAVADRIEALAHEVGVFVGERGGGQHD